MQEIGKQHAKLDKTMSAVVTGGASGLGLATHALWRRASRW
jgi:NAD(P)-dependent dehydrogenase (short-subunit alcohol dehydrogenase family)